MTNSIATNRKAYRDYTILESFEAGIALSGTEVKSLREGKADLTDSFARIEGSQALLYNLYISPYEFGNRANLDSKRLRKLLLHKKEMSHLVGKVQQKGFALIPLELYFNERGFCKVRLAIAKGKKLYDKREELKKREADRQLRKIVKHRLR